MKRIFCIIFTLVLCLLLLGCNEKDWDSVKMDNMIDSVVSCGFESQEYTDEQIIGIEVNFKMNPDHTLNDTILRINHLIKPLNGGFEYVYIYLFETAEDAQSILNTYAKYTSEYTKISDRVLAFGSSQDIDALRE